MDGLDGITCNPTSDSLPRPLLAQEAMMSDPYIVQLDIQIADLKGRLAGLEQAKSLYQTLQAQATAPRDYRMQLGTGQFVVRGGQLSGTRRPSKIKTFVWELLAAHPKGLTSREVNDLARAGDATINDKTVTSMLSVAARNSELHRDPATGRYSLPGAVAIAADPGEADADGADDAAASDDLSDDEDGGYERAAA
jgi:hypothetical protein